MKVAVSVHGRFHGFDLARELNTQNALAGLLTTYPAYLVRRYVGTVDFLATASLLEVQRRLCERIGRACGDVDGRIHRMVAAAPADLPQAIDRPVAGDRGKPCDRACSFAVEPVRPPPDRKIDVLKDVLGLLSVVQYTQAHAE